MIAMIGNAYASPTAPSGMSSVSAASGPYAADDSASSPSTGMPAAGPMRWCSSSSVASRPSSQSSTAISDLPT